MIVLVSARTHCFGIPLYLQLIIGSSYELCVHKGNRLPLSSYLLVSIVSWIFHLVIEMIDYTASSIKNNYPNNINNVFQWLSRKLGTTTSNRWSNIYQARIVDIVAPMGVPKVCLKNLLLNVKKELSNNNFINWRKVCLDVEIPVEYHCYCLSKFSTVSSSGSLYEKLEWSLLSSAKLWTGFFVTSGNH